MMTLLVLIEELGIAFITMHFLTPSIYYVVALGWLRSNKRSGDKTELSVDPPLVSVIIPTYNEAKAIIQKLNNVYSQDYPRDRFEVIIVDSGSTDRTVELIHEWIKGHDGINVRVIEEGARMGKMHALNTALKYAKGDIIVITDADSAWTQDSLRNAVTWLMTDGVGAVSCNKIPRTDKDVEAEYRSYYGLLRIAESRKFSSAIFHGELAAYRRDLLEKIGGFPMDVGADDSHTAGLISMLGYRAIIPENVRCIEYVPSKGYWMWRIRRAQHLIQHFLRILKYMVTNGKELPRDYRQIMLYESYLHLINPWLFVIGFVLVIISAMHGAIIPIVLILIGMVLLAIRFFRTWITTQVILVVASIRNLWNKELVWRKIEK
ncbi:glycosyl transferase, family 2 [Vulcanisaeta moutnovskia 768-28]|uniref:Glycosyl transferase, family 2 n=1 Tax=Vulcanisaeta moutnovskia (strain 768-28) TaxID=985053 RepID=F0QY80_VULM7|nr:glycosyltransferase [Vulcanisaeta moutnovskia]ADY01317.1 glycosyl transferase, family 2 [Vulcanisaeta moutnovskia 768-28]